MEKVAIVTCKDYDRERVCESVDRALELIDAGKLLGGSMLIKPNVMGAFAPSSGIITHPRVCAAIINAVRDHGQQVLIGDSPAGVTDSDALSLSWRESGYADLCDETKIDRVVFESRVTMRPPRRADIDVHYLAADVIDADVVINVPKLKSHRLMRYTGAVKNLMGVIPGSRKAHIHRLDPDPNKVASVIVDVMEIVRPQITVMDAIDVLEGDGPGASGKKKRAGLIIAGTDPVAVDAVCCQIIGIEPMSVPTTAIACERGLGTADLDQIEVVGESIADVAIDFEKAPLGKWDTGSRFVQRFWELARTKIKIDGDRCVVCGKCVQACPVDAIVGEESLEIDGDNCIECYCCHEVCPYSAVIIERQHKGF